MTTNTPVSSSDVLIRKDVRWDFMVASWSADEVRKYAVEDAEWQDFRLTLRGLPTITKLWKLKDRYINLCAKLPPVHVANAEWTLEERERWNRGKCQIDNYINALKRGGILDRNGYIKRP